MSSDRITDKTVIALPIPAFWTLVVLLVVGTSVSTAAFVSIKTDIARLGRESLTVNQFREWQDEFRAINEGVRVPPLRSHADDERPKASLYPVVVARKDP